MKIESNSAEETFALGKQCGEKAAAGQVYCLYGDLGVGKTVFTKGFAAGLGIKEPVSSPTFTILQVYDEGRLPFYHFDVYRISDPEEMYEIGFEEYIEGEGVCFNVYVYNVQPGITIDYATGENWQEGAEPQSGETTYILNTNSHKFHDPDCSSVSGMSTANRQEYTGSREDLIAQGYTPCGQCNP